MSILALAAIRRASLHEFLVADRIGLPLSRFYPRRTLSLR